MTIFKTFFKVLLKYKFIIIMYTAILIFFSGFNSQNNQVSTTFNASKPDVVIINEDENIGITKCLVDYISKNSNVKKISKNKLDDALFYRDVNYIIYIKENFRKDFLSGIDPKVEVKSTGDYQASLASMLLDRFLNLSSFYRDVYSSEEDIINHTEKILDNEVKVEVTKKIDTDSLSKATLYYNFLNYSILSGCIYVICLILSSFKSNAINKRTIISSMNYKSFNRKLLLSNMLYAGVLWLFYVILSFILIGKVMITSLGVMYIVNSFVFLIVALCIAFLIGNLINNKEALNGIINVIALGSSFLCGAFVPMEWLPKFVLKIAHILPSYWFIKNNEIIGSASNVSNILSEYSFNILIMFIFVIVFVMLTNIVSAKKRKIA